MSETPEDKAFSLIKEWLDNIPMEQFVEEFNSLPTYPVDENTVTIDKYLAWSESQLGTTEEYHTMLHFRSSEIKDEILRAYAFTESIEQSHKTAAELDEAYGSLYYLFRDYILQRTEEIYANNLNVLQEFDAMFEFLNTVGYEPIEVAQVIGFPNPSPYEDLPF